MGFFSDLFRKKEGGSRVGNVIRNIGDRYTGGLYSEIVSPRPEKNKQTSKFGKTLDNLFGTR